VADRAIFDKLIQVLVFGCGYRKLADQTCSATTIRERRDQWIALGIFATLELLVLQAYDRMVGLELADLAVDGCITKAPCGGQASGRSPVDRGKQGRKRSTVVEARRIPLDAVAAGANAHDSPLLARPWTPWSGWSRSPPSPLCTWTQATTATRPARCWTRGA
jgi:transposase